MKRFTHTFLTSLLALTSSPVMAGVTVTQPDGSAAPNVTVQNPTAGHWTVTFGGSADGDYYINATSSDIIDAVRSGATIGHTVRVYMPASAGAIGLVDLTDPPPSQPGIFQVKSLNAVGNIGTVRAHEIVDITATAGDLTGSMTVLDPGATKDIGTIDFANGTIRADIRNDYGGIASISASRIEGPSAQNPITITCRDSLCPAPGFLAVEIIDNNAQVVGGDVVYARFGDPVNNPSMLLGHVQVGGSFTGDMNARVFDAMPNSQGTIPPGVQVRGNFDGVVRVSEAIAPDFGANSSGGSVACSPGPDDFTNPYQPCSNPGIEPRDDPRFFPALVIGGGVSAASEFHVPAYVPAAGAVCQTGGVESVVVIGAGATGGRMLGRAFFLHPADPPNGHPTPYETELAIVHSTDPGVDGQYAAAPATLGHGSISQAPFGIRGSASTLRILHLNAGQRTIDEISESVNGSPNEIVPVPYRPGTAYLSGVFTFTGPVAPADPKTSCHDFIDDTCAGCGGGDERLHEELVIERFPPDFPGSRCWCPSATPAQACAEEVSGCVPPNTPLPCVGSWQHAGIALQLKQTSPTRIYLLGKHTETEGSLTTRWAPENGFQLLNGWTYRVRPNIASGSDNEPLLSKLAEGTEYFPVSVPANDQDAFTFTVGCPCVYDLNFSGIVDTGDLTLLLNDFGHDQTTCADQATNGTPPRRSNFVVDAAINTADLTAFLSRFGQSCCEIVNNGQAAAGGLSDAPESHGITRGPMGDHVVQYHDNADENGSGASATQINVPPPTGPILSALGFTSQEQYETYVNSLTPQAQIEHIRFLVDLARALGYE